jgi:hypothetical protein
LPETVEGGCQHLANPSEPEKQMQAGDVWPWRNDLPEKRLAGMQFEAGKKWAGTHTRMILPPLPPWEGLLLTRKNNEIVGVFCGFAGVNA